MRFLVCVSLLGLAAGNLTAASPKVLRKPLVTYTTAKPAGKDNGVYTAGLSPDGKLVACVHGGQLSVYSVVNAKPLFVTRPEAVGASMVVFSADGKLVAFPGKGKRIELLSARTGASSSSVEVPGENPGAVQALALSPDGRQLALSCGHLFHMDLHVLDTTTGKPQGKPLEDIGGLAYQLLFSADGKRLVANYYSTVYVVDAASLRLTAGVKAQTLATFFEAGRLYAVEEDTAAIRDITGGSLGKETLGQFVEQLDNFSAVRMAIAGRPAVAAIPHGNEITVRDRKGRERFRVIGEDSPIRRICLSVDGRVLLVYRMSLRVEVFRLE